MKRQTNEKTLRPHHVNAGITVAYRKKIMRLVDEMQRSYVYWLKATYRADPPVMAQDAMPARELEKTLADLGVRWQKQFDAVAPELARFFAKSVSAQSDAVLKSILRKAGYSVKFSMTKALRDVMKAEIVENVGLIKSIPQQYHTQVQGMVMRSVQTGRDLAGLSKEMQKRYGITKRRADFIALDQNNKATSAIQRIRQTELGIEKGKWLHSHTGREPRPTHVANDGKTFSIAEGWYDPDPRVKRRIWPGELIRCRCTWKPIVKGFS